MHVYNDGSVHLNHGGTEMGQGLNTKVAQVVADEFQIDLDRVQDHRDDHRQGAEHLGHRGLLGLRPQRHGGAQRRAQIKDRLIDFAAEHYGVPHDQVVFLPNRVRVGNQEIPFDDLVKQAYMARVQLSAAGFYKTPKIHWDRATGKGRPFYYFAYGAAVLARSSIDTLTGEYHVERTDILHDVGRSLNPAIDIGPDRGRLHPGHGLAHHRGAVVGQGGPAAHARALDLQDPARLRPAAVFNVALADWAENREPTIRRSKAVGEPPFMLAISVLQALSDAVASVADYRICPRLDAPATPERVLMAIERLRAEAARS